MPRMKSISTCEFCVRRMCAVLLMARISSWRSSRYSALTRSVLFSRMRSAKATCSTASLTTPSGFSSFKCSKMCFESTTVRMPSKAMLPCTKSSAKKVCATGAGSARPVVSMMIPSKGLPLPVVCLCSFLRPAIRSPRTVQQMQPLFISMIFSSVTAVLLVFSKALSMPTSPNSFSMTAIFFPCISCRIWFNKVVFPAPKKPVMMVVGVFFAPPPVAWSSPATILPSISAFRFWRTSSPGFDISAASRSTSARFAAPKPLRRSARRA
mmetsp:Transcript_56823/g.114078  ORF Transcript_56823/g.114078 Transcript_56823/m.114078 type:complete len:267 (-) Transcript_56823:49-849(-)